MHTVNCNEIYFNNNSNINKTCSYICTVCQVSEIPLQWKGWSPGQWATKMLKNDKEPLDLVFLMCLRDLTDVSNQI